MMVVKARRHARSRRGRLWVPAAGFGFFAALSGAASPPAHADSQLFRRGDANADSRLNLSDAVYTLGFLFLGTPASLTCRDAADANDDGELNLADALTTLAYLFRAGPAPPSPTERCGQDASVDGLDCEHFDACPPAAAKEDLFPGRGYPTVDRPSSMAAADLDEDGDDDLVVSGKKTGVDIGIVSVHRNQGNAVFDPRVDHEAGWSPRFVSIADFDSDQHPDLAVVNGPLEKNGNGAVSILRNHGDGTFPSHTEYTVGREPRTLAAGDLDGDGDLDLVVSNADAEERSGSLSVLRNAGDGVFSAQFEHVLNQAPSSITLGDLDHDGDLDLALATNDAVDILLNAGDGGFKSSASFRVFCPNLIATRDLDGDADNDLVVATRENDRVLVFPNEGTGGFAEPAEYRVEYNAVSLLLTELNQDGRPDLVVGSEPDYGSDAISILRNQDRGAFAKRVQLDVLHPYAVAAGDLDRDGDVDLAVATPGPDAIRVLGNDGKGSFEAPPAQGTGWTRSIAIGDVDLDGDFDLAVAVGPRKTSRGQVKPIPAKAQDRGPRRCVGRFRADRRPLTVRGC